MGDCIFCDIVNEKMDATFVHKDDLVCAFMDIQPVNRGHVLIVPNEHATYLADLPEETGACIFRVAQRVAAALRASGLRCEGVNFFLADGEATMQEVFHVHFHVFPRFDGDGFGLRFPDGYATKPPRSDLEEAAVAIRRRLEDKLIGLGVLTGDGRIDVNIDMLVVDVECQKQGIGTSLLTSLVLVLKRQFAAEQPSDRGNQRQPGPVLVLCDACHAGPSRTLRL